MKKVHILLVEDSEGEILLTKEAFTNPKIKKISVARDGEDAINQLHHALHSSEKLLPDLVLLDINLPRISGKEVLQFIRQTARLKKIPVIMFTNASLQSEIDECYSWNANSFITKPSDLNRFCDVVRVIEDFWLDTVTLPTIN